MRHRHRGRWSTQSRWRLLDLLTPHLAGWCHCADSDDVFATEDNQTQKALDFSLLATRLGLLGLGDLDGSELLAVFKHKVHVLVESDEGAN